jgi:hypothetical protein
VAKSRFSNAVDMLELAEIGDVSADDKLSARIKAEHTKISNRDARIETLAQGDEARRSEALAIEALRKDVAHLAMAPDSPKAKALWDDAIANGETKDPYYVWLAKGSESRARMWNMTRLVEAGASLDDVYFIHEATIKQYKQMVAEHNARLAKLQG